jgi:hypothetical protein
MFYKLTIVDVYRGSANLIGRDGETCGKIKLDGFDETTFFDSQTYFEVIFLLGLNDKHNKVMLLEWNGGIAERRGVGELWGKEIKDNGFRPGPQWKEIILG